MACFGKGGGVGGSDTGGVTPIAWREVALSDNGVSRRAVSFSSHLGNMAFEYFTANPVNTRQRN